MKIWAYLVILTVILAALAGVYDAGYTKAEAKNLKAYNALEKKLEDQRIEYEKATNNLALELLNRKPERVKVYETIIKEVEQAAPTNPSCNISHLIYRVLNNASEGVQASYDTAKLNDEVTEITQAEAVILAVKWAKQYNELADSHDTLIDVVGALECVN